MSPVAMARKVNVPMIMAVFFIQLVSSHWDYNDQSDWWKLANSSCGLSKQSPIDLPDVCDKFNAGTRVNSSMKLTLINYNTLLPSGSLILSNNGHTSQLKFNAEEEVAADNSKRMQVPHLTGTVVNNQVYKLLQIHAHWDKTSQHIGSEHSLHSKRRAFEIHLVHFNIKYVTPQVASRHADGFAVMATFFDHDDDNNHVELEKIVTHLRHISQFNSSVFIKRPVNLRNLLPRDLNTFYSYEGSLTTPPCLQIIQWIIFPQVQNIGGNQLFAFERSLDTSNSQILSRTCRDLQPLNGRIVYASSDRHCYGVTPSQSSTTLIQSDATSASRRVSNGLAVAQINPPKPSTGRAVQVASSGGYQASQRVRPPTSGLLPALAGLLG